MTEFLAKLFALNSFWEFMSNIFWVLEINHNLIHTFIQEEIHSLEKVSKHDSQFTNVRYLLYITKIFFKYQSFSLSVSRYNK